jgi:hypothetical protein
MVLDTSFLPLKVVPPLKSIAFSAGNQISAGIVFMPALESFGVPDMNHLSIFVFPPYREPIGVSGFDAIPIGVVSAPLLKPIAISRIGDVSVVVMPMMGVHSSSTTKFGASTI